MRFGRERSGVTRRRDVAAAGAEYVSGQRARSLRRGALPPKYLHNSSAVKKRATKKKCAAPPPPRLRQPSSARRAPAAWRRTTKQATVICCKLPYLTLSATSSAALFAQRHMVPHTSPASNLNLRYLCPPFHVLNRIKLKLTLFVLNSAAPTPNFCHLKQITEG